MLIGACSRVAPLCSCSDRRGVFFGSSRDLNSARLDLAHPFLRDAELALSVALVLAAILGSAVPCSVSSLPSKRKG
jgi:hypothetical protein